MVPKLVGVFVVDRGGGGALATLFARLAAGVGLAEAFLDAGGGPEGVFDLGGGALACEAAISSRYRSPCTRNGRPYSSSHCSKIFLNSASTLGRSFAMRFRIFSSLSRRVGSRFSPLVPRSISLDAS